MYPFACLLLLCEFIKDGLIFRKILGQNGSESVEVLLTLPESSDNDTFRPSISKVREWS